MVTKYHKLKSLKSETAMADFVSNKKDNRRKKQNDGKSTVVMAN